MLMTKYPSFPPRPQPKPAEPAPAAAHPSAGFDWTVPEGPPDLRGYRQMTDAEFAAIRREFDRKMAEERDVRERALMIRHVTPRPPTLTWKQRQEAEGRT